MRADIDLDVPTLYSPAQRATQQEIQLQHLQHKIDALQAAHAELKSRSATVMYVSRSKRRKSSIKSRLVRAYHNQVPIPIRWAFWAVLVFSAVLLVSLPTQSGVY